MQPVRAVLPSKTVEPIEPHVNNQSGTKQSNPRHKQGGHVYSDCRPAVQQMKPNAATVRIDYGIGR